MSTRVENPRLGGQRSCIYMALRARGQVGHVLLPVSATHTPIPLKLHPARNAQISGTMVDENGKAVSGALVAYKPLGDWEYSLPWKRRPDMGQSVTKSDSQGHFQLRDIWPEESGWLAVSKPGLVGSQLSLTPKPGERLSLRPRLTRSGRYFSGKLVDSAQRPVAGATVVLESVTSRFQTQTTQDGSFRLLSPTEETCLLTATHARGTCSTRTRMHQSLRDGLVFQLRDGRKPSR